MASECNQPLTVKTAPPHRMLRRISVFSRLPLAEQAMALAAFTLIGGASAMIALFPFRWIAPILGTPNGAVGYAPLIDARENPRARLIRRAIGRAAVVAPFRADCLPQSFAAAVMARALRVPLATHLGVRMEDDAMRAHAWSIAGPIAVCGGDGVDRFAIVSCFVIERRA